MSGTARRVRRVLILGSAKRSAIARSRTSHFLIGPIIGPLAAAHN
jgi:hypothetical protein